MFPSNRDTDQFATTLNHVQVSLFITSMRKDLLTSIPLFPYTQLFMDRAKLWEDDCFKNKNDKYLFMSVNKRSRKIMCNNQKAESEFAW